MGDSSGRNVNVRAQQWQRLVEDRRPVAPFDAERLLFDGMRDAWARVSSLPRPAAFRDQARYTGVMLDVAARLIGATLVLNLGRGDVAGESLDLHPETPEFPTEHPLAPPFARSSD